MKKFKFLFLPLAVAALFTVVSCNDDEDLPQTDGNIESIADVDFDAKSLKGNITKSITLAANQEYVLAGPLRVKEGATLTIEAGTTIKATVGGTDVFLAVERGAKIIAKGTAQKPIKITSNAGNPRAGDWGGLVLAGKAPNNNGTDAETEIAGMKYGGTVPDDDSGVLEYVVLEYTGARINGEKEFNGFTFYSVGSKTTINNIAVFNGDDDGVEFFGGSVNVTNVMVVNAKDDMFDWTEGYTGKATNVYCVREASFKDVSEDPRGLEGDSNETDNARLPLSNPTIDKLTIIHNAAAVTMPDMIKIRRGSKATVTNAYVKLGTGALAGDFVDLEDSKGNASSSVAVTVAGENIDTNKVKNAPGATVNVVAKDQVTGADFTAFAWTGYTTVK